MYLIYMDMWYILQTEIASNTLIAGGFTRII